MARADDVRVRILDAALELLEHGGREAVSTRAITSAVSMQAPTLYRIFGDKQGLLDALAVHGFDAHLASWDGWESGADPVDTLRQGWDMHVQWGIGNPGLYSIAYGDARPGVASPASLAIDAILRTLIEQVAATGRLLVPVDDAVNILRAVGTGVVLTLIAMPEDRRDMSLSDRGRDAALASFLAGSSTHTASSGTAMRLRSELDNQTGLTPNERALLGDWLDRLARG